ncbi:MAG: hypothetical protein Q9182_000825 [Xanthomendoza sp. 2 TL-2023]
MVKFPQQKATKASRSSATTQKNEITDPRFANIQTDPRFRIPSKRNTHVQIDERFERMLRDEAFSSRAKIDRYGCRLPKDAERKELEKYYRFQKGEDIPLEGNKAELDLKPDTGNEEEPSSSAEESSSEESDVDFKEDDEVFGLLDAQDMGSGTIPVGEVTSRIAVVNLDWDNIRAADLMAVFSSFVPAAGAIKKILIYPSEFGRERIKREEMQGPPTEIFSRRKMQTSSEGIESEFEDHEEKPSSGDEDDEQIKKSLLQKDTSQDFDSAKLRRYQLERLRYYYAVLICSSPSLAQKIYEAVDGTEYLTTANFFDLRFIPNGVEFTQDAPRDECTRIPDGYRPNEFVTDALQHSKVRLTWDADDGTRKEAQKRAFSASRANIDENDLKAYLGSDSSDDEADKPVPLNVDATSHGAVETNQRNNLGTDPTPLLSKKDTERQRMRALLGVEAKPTVPIKKSKTDAAPVGDIQITFSSGLTSSLQPNQSVFANSPDEREETTVEKYVRKEKERKARRKSTTKTSSEHAARTFTNAPQTSDEHRNPDPEETKALGFSDPFFTDVNSTKTSKTTAAERKAAKRIREAQSVTEEAATSTQRAELELLTMDEGAHTVHANGEGRGVRHFDMREVLKAEKTLAKSKKSKGKRKKMVEREKEALEAKAQDGFRIDVQDLRFAAVYQRPEFAIDPSHSRYQGTESMNELLEEGRRKRKRGDSEVEDGGGRNDQRKSKETEKGEMLDGQRQDVEMLVEKIKRKSKR